MIANPHAVIYKELEAKARTIKKKNTKEVQVKMADEAKPEESTQEEVKPTETPPAAEEKVEEKVEAQPEAKPEEASKEPETKEIKINEIVAKAVEKKLN